MTVKEAVKLAKEHILDLFAEENISTVGWASIFLLAHQFSSRLAGVLALKMQHHPHENGEL